MNIDTLHAAPGDDDEEGPEETGEEPELELETEADASNLTEAVAAQVAFHESEREYFCVLGNWLGEAHPILGFECGDDTCQPKPHPDDDIKNRMIDLTLDIIQRMRRIVRNDLGESKTWTL